MTKGDKMHRNSFFVNLNHKLKRPPVQLPTKVKPKDPEAGAGPLTSQYYHSGHTWTKIRDLFKEHNKTDGDDGNKESQED